MSKVGGDLAAGEEGVSKILTMSQVSQFIQKKVAPKEQSEKKVKIFFLNSI